MKRKITAIILIVALALSLGLVPAASVGASNGSIVGLWHFDEGTGTTAFDSSGNVNNGTINGATWTTDSAFGAYALSFDGVDDYVDFGDKFEFGTGESFTAECWVKTSTTPDDRTEVAGIYAGPTYPTPNQFWAIFLENDGTVSFWLRVSGGSATATVWGSTDVTDGYWHHIAAVKDVSSAKMKLYVDGSMEGGQVAFTDGPTNNGYPFRVGNGHWGRYYNGLIDEVRIWDTATPGWTVSAEPEEAANGITLEHEITATIDPAASGVTVYFDIDGPNNSESGSAVTDEDGEATFSYTGDGGSGADTTTVWVDQDLDGELDDDDPSLEVTKEWVTLVSLTPSEAFNPVGTNHTVTATVSSAVDGVEVWFEVTGDNTASGSEFTDDGVATFNYSGNNPGTDTIRAYFDTDGSGTWDDSEPSLTVTKYWLEHYVTGGGIIREGKGKTAAKITFGGNVGFDLAGDEVGQWQCNFHNVKGTDLDKGHFHTTEITDIGFLYESRLPDASPPDADYNYAHFNADGTFNGEDGWWVRVNVTDCGEGTNTLPDQIRIRLYNGSGLAYDSSVPVGDFPDAYPANRTDLDGGNIQIHPPEIPIPQL